jgi:flagellar motor switch protein FliG
MGNILRHGLEAYQKCINQPKPEEGLVKTTKQEKPDAVAADSSQKVRDKAKTKDTKFRRVAKFLILIGSEQAAGILAELDPENIQNISKEIATIRSIAPEEATEILTEFQAIFSQTYRLSGFSRGGIETARRILYAAKGPEKGEALLNKAVPDSKENIFGFLEEFSPEQLVMLLKAESAQTAALILSRLQPKISASVINKLPTERKAEILKRAAYQEAVSPEVLERVAAALKEKVRKAQPYISGGAKDIEINGMQALAAILKQGDYSFGDKIINELEESSPDIGKELKEKLYTLDDIILTVDKPLQEKLKTMTDRDIAVLLKGRGQEFCEKLLSCVSAGRRQLIREESDILGAIPRRECDAAAGDFLSWFRTARESGDIILYSDEDVVL